MSANSQVTFEDALKENYPAKQDTWVLTVLLLFFLT